MRKTLLVLSLIVLITVLIFLGWSKWFHARPENFAKVTIAYIPFTSSSQLFVAVENGYFRDEGLEVAPIQYANSNAAMNALLTGEVNASVGNGIPTVLPIEENESGSLKIFQPSLETRQKFASNILVRRDAPFKTINDLKGHRIGTYSGATQRNNLQLLLKKFMDPERDVDIVQVDSSLQIQAFEAGQMDALFTIEPTSTIIMQLGAGRILDANVRVKYILDPFPAAVNSFRSDFVRAHRDIAAKIVRALGRASVFIRDHEKDARLFIAKYLPMEPAVAEKCGLYEWSDIDNTDYAAIQKLSDLMKQTGELRSPVQIEPLFIKENDLE